MPNIYWQGKQNKALQANEKVVFCIYTYISPFFLNRNIFYIYVIGKSSCHRRPIGKTPTNTKVSFFNDLFPNRSITELCKN